MKQNIKRFLEWENRWTNKHLSKTSQYILSAVVIVIGIIIMILVIA